MSVSRSTAQLLEGKLSDYIQPIIEDLMVEAGPLDEMYLSILLKLAVEIDEFKAMLTGAQLDGATAVLAFEKLVLAHEKAMAALASYMKLKMDEKLLPAKIDEFKARAELNRVKVAEAESRVVANKAKAVALEEGLKMSRERLELYKEDLKARAEANKVKAELLRRRLELEERRFKAEVESKKVEAELNKLKLRKLELEVAEMEKKADPRELIKKAVLMEK